MAEPGQRAISRLRHTAEALGLDWPSHQSLEERERTLDPNDPKDAAFMLAVRRAGRARATRSTSAASARTAAMAATYAHGTAPLRRLADRYVTEAALAVINRRPVPDWVDDRFLQPRRGHEPRRSPRRPGRCAVVELAEAVTLKDRVGEQLEGRVIDIDERGARDPIVHRAGADPDRRARGCELGQKVE